MVTMEQVIMIPMAAMNTECNTLSLLEQEGRSQLLITNFLWRMYWYWHSSQPGGSEFFFEETSNHFMRQGLWTNLMDPRQRHGESRGFEGSTLGSWQILQMGMLVVEEEWEREVRGGGGIPVLNEVTRGCGLYSKGSSNSSSSPSPSPSPTADSGSPKLLGSSPAAPRTSCSSQMSKRTSEPKFTSELFNSFEGASGSVSFSCNCWLLPAEVRLLRNCLNSVEKVARRRFPPPTADSEKWRSLSPEPGSPTVSILSILSRL